MKKFKKIILFMIVAIMSLSMFACGGGDDKTPTPPLTNSQRLAKAFENLGTNFTVTVANYDDAEEKYVDTMFAKLKDGDIDAGMLTFFEEEGWLPDYDFAAIRKEGDSTYLYTTYVEFDSALHTFGTAPLKDDEDEFINYFKSDLEMGDMDIASILSIATDPEIMGGLQQVIETYFTPSQNGGNLVYTMNVDFMPVVEVLLDYDEKSVTEYVEDVLKTVGYNIDVNGLIDMIVALSKEITVDEVVVPALISGETTLEDIGEMLAAFGLNPQDIFAAYAEMEGEELDWETAKLMTLDDILELYGTGLTVEDVFGYIEGLKTMPAEDVLEMIVPMITNFMNIGSWSDNGDEEETFYPMDFAQVETMLQMVQALGVNGQIVISSANKFDSIVLGGSLTVKVPVEGAGTAEVTRSGKLKLSFSNYGTTTLFDVSTIDEGNIIESSFGGKENGSGGEINKPKPTEPTE